VGSDSEKASGNSISKTVGDESSSEKNVESKKIVGIQRSLWQKLIKFTEELKVQSDKETGAAPSSLESPPTRFPRLLPRILEFSKRIE
jgi:hypothetical protein